MEILRKIKQIGNVSKFSWAEACSDHDGKTSMLTFLPAYAIFIAGIGFVYAGIVKYELLLNQSIMLFSIGFGALMGRKIINGKPQLEDIVAGKEEIETSTEK